MSPSGPSGPLVCLSNPMSKLPLRLNIALPMCISGEEDLLSLVLYSSYDTPIGERRVNSL